MYVDKDNSLKSILDQHFALQCPSCQALSNVTPISVPRFEMLARFKPKNVGLVYRCDSCNYPIFLKFGVKGYGAERVDLSPTFEQVELPVETFDYTYLPEEVERDFREALACFSISSFNAFGSMCRRTMQRVFADLGEAGKMKIFNQLKEVGELAELDADTYRILEKVIFGTDESGHPNMPDIDHDHGGLMLEVIKDILYEVYVRKGKLQQAMLLRSHTSNDLKIPDY